jgi:hypothetical protein
MPFRLVMHDKDPKKEKIMLTQPGEKYRPYPPIALPDRRWPEQK